MKHENYIFKQFMTATINFLNYDAYNQYNYYWEMIFMKTLIYQL